MSRAMRENADMRVPTGVTASRGLTASERRPVDGDVPLGEEICAPLAEMFAALANPARARIVHALVHTDATTSGLASMMGLSPPRVSQHLRLLRNLRIVKRRRKGRQVFYSLADAHISVLITLSLTHLREERGYAPLPAGPGHAPGEAP